MVRRFPRTDVEDIREAARVTSPLESRRLVTIFKSCLRFPEHAFDFSLSEPRGRRTFRETSPRILHAGDPAFHPALPGQRCKIPFAQVAVQPPLWQDSSPLWPFETASLVGRIAAIVNRAHNERYSDKTGFFGFFECENNPETARALFEKAAKVLRSKGLVGRFAGLTIRASMTSAACSRRASSCPRASASRGTPPIIEASSSRADSRRVNRSYGFLLPLSQLEPPERLKRIVDRVAKRSKPKLRPIDLNKIEKELEIVHEVYNATLERNWGFIPITMDDLLGAAADMKAFADPDMILIAEIDGENAGVALSLPNFNEILGMTKNTPRWLRLLHIVWLMKTHRINWARQVVYGISPRFRDKSGLHALAAARAVRLRQGAFRQCRLSGWIEETNTEILENSQLVGGIRRRPSGASTESPSRHEAPHHRRDRFRRPQSPPAHACRRA